MGWFLSHLLRLLMFFIGDQLRKMAWLILVTLPLLMFKQLFTRAIFPWWFMLLVFVGSWFFWT